MPNIVEGSLAPPPLISAGASREPVLVSADGNTEAVDHYVSRHPLACTYHRPEWTQVIRRAFGQRTTYLVAWRREQPVGVLPLVFFQSRLFGRFSVSLPFLNYGGVLADDPAVESALLDRAIEETQRRAGTHLELRHTRQHFATLVSKRHKVAMELQLAEDVDAQWHALDRKVRNQVRKAEKSGLHVTHGGPELLPAFYNVFARNMRDLGTPVYGRSFFEEVLAAFPGETRVFVVRLQQRPIAASLVHWFRDSIQVPWASALRDCNALCPNVLLYWHMLQYAVEQRFRTFDFGRSTPGEGTYNFKKQWGAEPRELVWEYWIAEGHEMPELNTKNPKFARAIRLWQRLPLPLATALGPWVVKNIP
jgi:serine/alanine adding enzyme